MNNSFIVAIIISFALEGESIPDYIMSGLWRNKMRYVNEINE